MAEVGLCVQRHLLSVATGGTAGSTAATPAFTIVSSSPFTAFAAGEPNAGSTQFSGDPTTRAMTFTDLTITYTATAAAAGRYIGFDLSYQNQPGVNSVGYFDNMRLTATPAPEPSTWAMMAVGAMGLVGVLRLRRQRA